ncbi:MAG: substrate-binding domain-containing protein [Ostreibacterium sp.]
MKKIGLFAIGLGLLVIAQADVKIASTTSTQNSGLYDYLIPILEKAIDDKIKVIAVGTGHALKLGENGDADLLIVHAPDREKTFIDKGYGIDRRPFTHNQFIIVGPDKDPAGVKNLKTAVEAFSAIQASGKQKKIQFISRGDNSGTYYKEKSLWKIAHIAPKGGWYRESGSGMGTTLNIAAAMNAYTLSDSSTWLKFANKQNLTALFSGDPVLFNQYSVILIPKARYPHVQYDKAKAIADWLISKKGQQTINAYRIKGVQAFTANAKMIKTANEDSQTQ